MINFRFHLASLVAIFLALALGVVIGAGVIDRGVVDALDNRLNDVEKRSNQIQAENSDLQRQISEQDEVIGGLAQHAIGGRLANADVGIVAVRGVDADRVNQTAAVLRDGGAEVTGVLWLESPWVLDDDQDVRDLAEAIGSTSRRPTVLREQAWQQIAARFSQSPLQTETLPETDDVLVALDDAGFVSFDALDGGGTLTQFPGLVASIVLVVGTEGDVPASDVVMPAASAIAADEIPLVVADIYVRDNPDAGARGDNLAELRARDLSQTVSTVDDLDRPQGPVTVAIAVADLLHVPPIVGHYGLGPDTVSLPERLAS